MEDWKKEVQELQERRDGLAKKVEATLIESGCTYGEARRVLDELSYRYRKKSGNLVEALNISEIAKDPL